MTPGPFTTWLVGLLIAVVVCTTVLVALDKVSGELFMGVIVGPIVGGVIGAVANAKGVQSGAQSVVSPPPST